jgi:hypothetical protein
MALTLSPQEKESRDNSTERVLRRCNGSLASLGVQDGLEVEVPLLVAVDQFFFVLEAIIDRRDSGNLTSRMRESSF